MKLPGFEILEQSGETRKTLVWRAKQLSLDRTVALKTLKPDLASDPAEVKEFVDDARRAADLKHPHIIQIYDVGEKDGTYFLVMEFVAGSTVSRAIRQQGPLPQKTALAVTRSVAKALDYAWREAHVIHRNVKPQHITIDEDGIVKLAYLGMAKRVDAEADTQDAGKQDTIEGTPHYMSPEQGRGITPLDFRTDMYSLGATLYHMVTGGAPFGQVAATLAVGKHIRDQVRDPRDVNPALSPMTAQLVKILMMKDPADRYSSWQEALKDIERAANGRILRKRTRPEAVSTVAAARRSRARREKTSTGVPAWVRVPAWLLLLAWWAVFAYSRVHTPPVPPPRAEVAPSSSPRETSEQPVAALTPTPPVPPAPASQPAVADSAPAPSPAPPVKPQVTVEESYITFERHLTEHLLSEDFTKALALVDEQRSEPRFAGFRAQLDRTRDLVAAASRVNEVVAEAFRRRIGETAVVFHKNEYHALVIREVGDDKIRGQMKRRTASGNPGPAVEFSVSQLGPIERSRWLGEANTIESYLMKCILHMAGGDYKSAKEFAAHCGPVANALGAEAEAGLAAPPSP